MINYSGSLTDTGGTPVANGNYNIEFKIYDVASGGASLWSEKWDTTTSQITVVGGVFNVMLGFHSQIPAAFFADHPVTYLGIKVGTDSEMLPRQQITSVGYAFTAGNGVPKGGIIMWSGSVASIPEGWALCDGTNGTPDLRDRFVVGAGSGYAVGATGGSANINVSHSHVINDHTHGINATDTNHSHNDDHNHNIQHQHYVSRVNDGTHNGSGRGMSAGSDYSGYTGWWPQEGTISNSKNEQGFGSTTGWMNQNWSHSHTMGGASDRGTDSRLSGAQDIRPPYYALAFIMKL